MSGIPTDPERVEAEWFSEALGTRVDHARVEPVSRQGRASRTYRAQLTSRAADSALPASVIIKCSLDDPRVQQRRLGLGTYRLEVDFPFRDQRVSREVALMSSSSRRAVSGKNSTSTAPASVVHTTKRTASAMLAPSGVSCVTV